MSAGGKFLRGSGIVLLILAAVVIASVTLRLSYAFQVFSFNSYANVPTIAPKTIVFSSDLKKPTRFNFIIFRNEGSAGFDEWMLRVCGMPGDSVEIRDGVLWVNNRLVDTMLTTSHNYLFSNEELKEFHVNDTNMVFRADSASVFIVMDKKVAARYAPSRKPYVLPDELVDRVIQEKYGEPWNMDHFGPVMVPAGHYFLLGDNRSASVDSRYLGFIPAKNFRGTVLNH